MLTPILKNITDDKQIHFLISNVGYHRFPEILPSLIQQIQSKDLEPIDFYTLIDI